MKPLALIIAVGMILALQTASPANSGTESAAFLNIPVGAAPAAMGSAYSASALDAYAPVWNPAGLAFVPDVQLAVQHLSYLESIHNEYVGAVFPIKKGYAFGGSLQYLASGDITGRDPSGQRTGDYSSHYGAYTLSYGQALGETLGIGASVKRIDAELAEVSGSAYAADLGTLYRPHSSVALAAVIANLGTSLRFLKEKEPLPLQARFGGAWRVRAAWTASVETVYSLKDRSLAGRLGGEWRPLPGIALRAGYRTDAISELSEMAGLTAGIGLRFWGQEFSYAWVPYGDLGDSQYFSLLLRFGGARDGLKNLSAPHATAELPEGTSGL